jgi:hypothetical protein
LVTSVEGTALRALGVGDAELHRLPIIKDLNGTLSFGEVEDQLPFDVKRYFTVFDVPSREVRGEHAHRSLKEFLVCLRGSCSVALDDSRSRTEVELDTPAIGLYIPPMIWRVHYKYSSDAILLVLASARYDADDYIRDYDLFVNEMRTSSSAIS